MPINKESLRNVIIRALEKDLNTASAAADTARDTATSKETVAENKYDTFGLEASYLAHGQSKRVHEFQQAIHQYTALPFKVFTPNDDIELSALVTLATETGEEKHFFLGPEAGGFKIQWEGKDIMVITISTPLGRQLQGKNLDDTIELHLGNKSITYDVVAIV